MSEALFQLLLFSIKAIIIAAVILIIVAGFLSLVARAKEKLKGRLTLKNLNQQFDEISREMLSEILPKKAFKQYLKQQKADEKAKQDKDPDTQKNVYVLDFEGDIKASRVSALREEINALIHIAKPTDEVVVRVESPGGMVSGYGLAASQLLRIREKNIPLTVIVDKVAASGGYMMACVANKILSAPFSMIGSIGVIVQLPNFNRFLKDKNIDFEQITAGNYKRTLTLFGENTNEGRKKLREEIEGIHTLFKNLIQTYRPQLDIEKVATGEWWLGKEALDLQLIDGLKTSDDYLLEQSKSATVYALRYETRKSFADKLSSTVRAVKEQAIMPLNRLF